MKLTYGLCAPYLGSREGKEFNKGRISEHEISKAECWVQVCADVAKEEPDMKQTCHGTSPSLGTYLRQKVQTSKSLARSSPREKEGQTVAQDNPSESHGLSFGARQESIGDDLEHV